MSDNISYRRKVDVPAYIRMNYKPGNNLLLDIKRSLKIGGVLASAVALIYGTSLAVSLVLVAVIG